MGRAYPLARGAVIHRDRQRARAPWQSAPARGITAERRRAERKPNACAPPFYAATAISYGAYATTADALWFHVGVVANIAGVASAVLAAIPGFIDWAFAVPSGHPAKTTGLEHLLLHIAALSLFAVDAVLQGRQWSDPSPASGAGLALAVVGLGLTVGAGFLGWKMVQTHHVGVAMTPEQERLDTAPRSTRADRPSIHATPSR